MPQLTQGQYILSFNGVPIGSWIDGFSTNVRRVNAVGIRQNFWSSVTVLDGKYPALVYEHTFQVFFEAISREALAQAYMALTTFYLNRVYPLAIIGGFGMSFGNCYLEEGPTMKEPDILLRHRAALISLKFLGNTRPA
jgi:hypothetical protein